MMFVKVKHPAKLPSMSVLRACKVGLMNKINRTINEGERQRLRDIKKEIQDLMDML